MYTVKYLFDFTRNVFVKMGCSNADAEKIADVFIAAELTGVTLTRDDQDKGLFPAMESQPYQCKTQYTDCT